MCVISMRDICMFIHDGGPISIWPAKKQRKSGKRVINFSIWSHFGEYT